MIPNHSGFIAAIHERRKVCVRFYSQADSGILDRVCAPLDYGPGGSVKGESNRYWLWDFAGQPGARILGLVPQQVLDMQVLGEDFDPAQLDERPAAWSIPREWDGLPAIPAATPP